MIIWNKLNPLDMVNSEDKNNRIYTLSVETSSCMIGDSGRTYNMYEEPNEPCVNYGCVYAWTLGIDGRVYYGRSIKTLVKFIRTINMYDSKPNIFVHGLSDILQHIKGEFEWTGTNDGRLNIIKSGNEVVKITSVDGIKFRCSEALSDCKMHELKGNFGLDIEGNVLTPKEELKLIYAQNSELSDSHFRYLETKNRTIYKYINYELKEVDYQVDRIPDTVTGKTRSLYRKKLASFGANNLKWRKEDAARIIPKAEEYKMLRRAFWGGYINYDHDLVEQTLDNVYSTDEVSAYAYVMLTKKFPCEAFRRYPLKSISHIEDVAGTFDDYAYLMTLKFTNIKSKTKFGYIPFNKSYFGNDNFKLTNDFVMQADDLVITCTEQDYEIIYENYDYDNVDVLQLEFARKNYLSHELLTLICDLFEDKQHYKDIKDSVKYNQTKKSIASLYGISVTNYMRNSYNMNNEMESSKLDIQERLDYLSDNEILLMPMQWGAWITAYARRELWDIISVVNNDIIYCDTDCVKMLNYEKYIDKIGEHNLNCKLEIENAIEKNTKLTGIKLEVISDLGQFVPDSNYGDDMCYAEFRMIGKKQYAYRKKELVLKVSGINGKLAVNDLKNDINNYNKNTVFTASNSGRVIQYQDNMKCAKTCNIVDENGAKIDLIIEGVYWYKKPQAYVIRDKEYETNIGNKIGINNIVRIVKHGHTMHDMI